MEGVGQFRTISLSSTTSRWPLVRAMSDTSISPSRQIVLEPAPKVDENANTEAALISEQKLTKFKRSEQVQTHVHWAALAFFWIAFASLTGSALLLLFHMAAPSYWHFLTEAQKSELKTVLLAVLGSSVFTDRLKRTFASDSN